MTLRYASVKGNPPHLGKVWGIGEWGWAMSSNSPISGALEGVKYIYFFSNFCPMYSPTCYTRKAIRKNTLYLEGKQWHPWGSITDPMSYYSPTYAPLAPRWGGGQGYLLTEALQGLLDRVAFVYAAAIRVSVKFPCKKSCMGHKFLIYTVFFFIFYTTYKNIYMYIYINHKNHTTYKKIYES